MKFEYRQEIGLTMRPQDGLLMQILLLLLDNSELDKPNRHLGVIQYLESRIAQNIAMEEMAQYFHISVRHLNRIFKSKFKMSVHQYHEMIRIQLSKNLLKNTNLTIHEISLRVGYQDALYFSRIFKKATQISPLFWRKSVAKE
jgi:AraC-like DNA-binding protein